jgi:hypothetical protein
MEISSKTSDASVSFQNFRELFANNYETTKYNVRLH